jgi:hypothetical protein
MWKPRWRWSPPGWTRRPSSWRLFWGAWSRWWRPWSGHGVPMDVPSPTPPHGLPLTPAPDQASTALHHLTMAVEANTAEVRSLRRSLATRPSRTEVAHRRRVVVVAGLVLGLGGLFSLDQHTSSCAPGVYPREVVELLAAGMEMQEALAVGGGHPLACDVVTPLHTHDSRQDWPTTANALGLLGYTLAAFAATAYAFGPGHWRSPGRERRKR